MGKGVDLRSQGRVTYLLLPFGKSVSEGIKEVFAFDRDGFSRLSLADEVDFTAIDNLLIGPNT